MRIRIRHQTDYAYSEPIRSGVQYLRMRPRSGPTQAVQDWRVTAPGSLTQWIDHVGNICHTLTIEQPAGIISVVVAGVVETFEGNGVMPMDEEEPPVEAFLRDSPYTGLDDRLRDLAESHRAAVEADRLDGLHALMQGVTKAVEYREGETHAHTTAAEALANGFGVCQDHAHVYIAVCRVLGVPARYVSGYLCTGGGEHHSASHAWAEGAVPGLGWVSFDPANGVSATETYVRVAAGADYASACPLRGIRTGGGEESVEVSVMVQGQQ